MFERLYIDLKKRINESIDHELHFLAGLAAAAPLLVFAALSFVFGGLLLGFDAPPFAVVASTFAVVEAPAFDELPTPYAFLKMTSIVLLSIPVSNLSKLYMYFIYLSFSIS